MSISDAMLLSFERVRRGSRPSFLLVVSRSAATIDRGVAVPPGLFGSTKGPPCCFFGDAPALVSVNGSTTDAEGKMDPSNLRST